MDTNKHNIYLKSLPVFVCYSIPNTDFEFADNGILSLPLHRFLFVYYFVRKSFPIHDLILKN